MQKNISAKSTGKKRIENPFKNIKPSYVIAAGLAVAAGLWIASGTVIGNAPKDEGKSADEKTQVAPLVRVQSITAKKHISEVVLFGRTEAVKGIDIIAETAGQIVARTVKKGARVDKGTVIMRLAMNDRLSQLAEAKAKVAYQEIAYQAAKKLSQKQFQSKIKLASELADLEKARAALERIKLDIHRTKIRAPIDGFVDTMPLSIGDYVRSGDRVAGMVNLDPIRIVGYVSERDVTRIQLKATAKAILPDGRRIAGPVHYISKVGSNATRTFRVDVWVDNPDSAIPEGLTSELRLPAESLMAHLVSPAVLTLNDAGAIGVKAVDDNKLVRFYPVKIIADTSEGIWLGGLPDKVSLITVGQEFVRHGQPVRTQTEEAGKNPS